jgi:hypothetical protein
MLAEKFFLVLETLRSHASDGSVKVINTAPHMDNPAPPFPNLPGWHFSVTETSMSVYRAEGLHADGRTVSRVAHDLPLLIKEIGEDAQNLPKRRKT